MNEEEMKKKTIYSIIFVLIAILALSACNIAKPSPEVDPASQTQVAIFAMATLTKYAQQQPTLEPTEEEQMPTFTPLPTEEAPTDEATEPPVEATDAPTEPPTTEPTAAPSAQPTAIPQATTPANLPEPPADAERISFAAGTTNKTVAGSVEAQQSKKYVVWLSKWQLIDIATSADNAAYIAVKTPSGQVLVNFSNRWLWYRDFAQETGDYVIEVSGGNFKSNYNLFVSVPQAISFERGTSSLTARATVPGEYGHDFSFWANQGQKMTISLSQADKFVLAIKLADGTVILSADSKANSFDGVLPKAGTYIVTIHNISNETVTVDFKLSIK
jgi:hypothetical protein